MEQTRKPFKSPYKLAKEKQEKEVYDYFNELSSDPEAQVQEVNKEVMRKFEIHSAATVFNIRNRVQKRIDRENA